VRDDEEMKQVSDHVIHVGCDVDLEFVLEARSALRARVI
jgi:hypothetical protein